MTDREKVAQAIWALKSSDDISWNQVAEFVKDSYRAIAEQIIALIVDEDAKLPKNWLLQSIDPGHIAYAQIYRQAQQDMLAAGWRKIRGNDGT